MKKVVKGAKVQSAILTGNTVENTLFVFQKYSGVVFGQFVVIFSSQKKNLEF